MKARTPHHVDGICEGQNLGTDHLERCTLCSAANCHSVTVTVSLTALQGSGGSAPGNTHHSQDIMHGGRKLSSIMPGPKLTSFGDSFQSLSGSAPSGFEMSCARMCRLKLTQPYHKA